MSVSRAWLYTELLIEFANPDSKADKADSKADNKAGAAPASAASASAPATAPAVESKKPKAPAIVVPRHLYVGNMHEAVEGKLPCSESIH